MKEKMNKYNYKERLKEKHGDKFTFLEEYITSKTPIKCKCNTCGYIWKKAPYELIGRETGCPNCSSLKGGFGHHNKFTQEDYENKLIKLFGENPYEFITPFIDYKHKITVKHKKCDYIFEAKPSNLVLNKLTRPTCKNCFINNNKTTTEKYQKKLDDFFGKDKSYDILEDYIDENTAIKHRCRICKYEWKTSPANISSGLYGKNRVCPSCNHMKRDDFHNLTYSERLKKIGSKLIPLEKYINRKTPILHRCTVCGYEWKTNPGNILSNKTGCPKCSHRITQSKYELKMIKMIKDNSDLEIIEKDRKILEGQELDIYIPEKKVAIEIDGVYWHCSDFKDKDYHINKTKNCKNKGIKLIHVFDIEDFNIVSTKIKKILDIGEFIKIDAKNCYIEKLCNEYKKEFLENNDLLGDDSSSIKLGMWYPKKDGDELVSIITLKVNKDNSFTILRYCDDGNYIVNDSLKYFLNYINNHYNFNYILSYNNLKFPNEKLFLNNNFTFDHTIDPDYFYINRNTKELVNKSYFNEKKVPRNFKRIYNCGYNAYILEKN